ncbi:GlxA family transcriptional regulator [Marivibrio halodurans]|uniref:GlxA family transcriptional regulator n=1 Tax=Marivibrio halodurans TaxID=2039722 RepID=A0A8J7S337_9PROT|nr:GlxA family transcriptional regulator [Marivibrio halodurans]MBP5855804.1 GlxA family transcriptional regulator [Marivibrio halodurans]
MFTPQSHGAIQRIGFLLLPKFSLLAFASAIEPLRVANLMAGRTLYEWRLLSEDGEPVSAVNGMASVVDHSLDDAPALPAIVVTASYEHEPAISRRILSWLRRAAVFGARLGAIDTGSFALARAGLLDGYRATTHWEELEAFAERFPRVEARQDLFTVDRDRFTSAGGTAGLDMMLNLIRMQHGQDLATAVADFFVYARIRDARDSQRMPLRARLATSNPHLIRAVEAMEAALEETIPIPRVAKRAGISERELERMFRRWLNTTPARYYRGLRLDRARGLLQQTDMPVLEVATACGFNSAAHFARSYRQRFGRSPTDDRSLS